jgi:hypothetical protein
MDKATKRAMTVRLNESSQWAQRTAHDLQGAMIDALRPLALVPALAVHVGLVGEEAVGKDL